MTRLIRAMSVKTRIVVLVVVLLVADIVKRAARSLPIERLPKGNRV